MTVLLGAAWWWLGLSERPFQAAREASDALLPLVFDGRVSAVIALPDGSWKVRTTLPVAGSSGAQVAVFFIDRVPILRGFISFPLLWAMLIASHRPWWGRLASGTLLLAGLVLLQIAAIVWLRLVVMQRAEPSFVMESMRPPDFRVTGEAVATWEWMLSNHVLPRRHAVHAGCHARGHLGDPEQTTRASSAGSDAQAAGGRAADKLRLGPGSAPPGAAGPAPR